MMNNNDKLTLFFVFKQTRTSGGQKTKEDLNIFVTFYWRSRQIVITTMWDIYHFIVIMSHFVVRFVCLLVERRLKVVRTNFKRSKLVFFFLRDSLSITESESKKSVNILVVEPLGTEIGGGKPYNSHTTTTTPSSNSIKCQFPTLFPWVCASGSIKIIKNNTHTHRVCLQ